MKEIDFIVIIARFIKLLKKWKYMIIIFPIIGISIACISYFTATPYYEGKIIINNHLVAKEIIIETLKNLKDIIHDNNRKFISEKFNISQKGAASIKSIILKSDFDPEELKENDFLLLQLNIQLFNKKYFDEVTAGVIYYINNNPYIKKSTQIKQTNLHAQINKINEEIAELDSMQKQLIESNNIETTYLKSDKLSTHSESIELMEKKNKLSEQLAYKNAIIITDQYYDIQTPNKPSIILLITAGMFSFFIIAVLLIFMIEVYKKSKNLV
mgnify:CR=1 FL=1